MNKKNLTIALVAASFLVTGCTEEKTPVKNSVKVKTMMVTPMSIEGGQSYSGTVEAASSTTLSFNGMGTIKNLNIQEGQNVKSGQLIGEIEASSSANGVSVAHAATVQAQEMLKQAEDAHSRMKMLHDNGSLPEIKWVEVETKVAQAKQMLEQAQASEKIAEKNLNDTKLTAPFNGYISQKSAEMGQNVVPGMPVATLVNIDNVNVKISVPEDEIANLKIGQKVTFKVASLGNITFSGTISEKNVTADNISHAYIAKVLVQNKDHKLLPGMVCDVYTSSSKQDAEIMLPSNIIQIDIDNKPFVWTSKDGAAQRVSVQLGENYGENIIIKDGLSQGDKVIVEGQQKVSNGMKIVEL